MYLIRRQGHCINPVLVLLCMVFECHLTHIGQVASPPETGTQTLHHCIISNNIYLSELWVEIRAWTQNSPPTSARGEIDERVEDGGLASVPVLIWSFYSKMIRGLITLHLGEKRLNDCLEPVRIVSASLTSFFKSTYNQQSKYRYFHVCPLLSRSIAVPPSHP